MALRRGCERRCFVAPLFFNQYRITSFRKVCQATPISGARAALRATRRLSENDAVFVAESSSTSLARELVERGSLRSEDEALFASQTNSRAQKMQQVVESRTRRITFLLDDVHGVHNLAAVVRSCDAWGIADLHCVLTPESSDGREKGDGRKSDGDRKQDGKRFHRNGQSLMELFERESMKRVSKAAHRWLSVFEYASAKDAVSALKSRGYRICVSSLSPEAKPLADVSLDGPVAFVFGNEHSGVSQELFQAADEKFTIPMYGFVESMNISVAAATVAGHVVDRARKAEARAPDYFLSREQQAELYRQFLRPNPLVPRKIHQVSSKYDVTRLGSALERHITSKGMFVESNSRIPEKMAAAVELLEKNVRFGAETGTVVHRHFVKRVKAGALGDRMWDKRAAHLLTGLAGLGALSCESCLIDIHDDDDDTKPLFASRHRILPSFQELIRETNRVYSGLFDEAGSPILPVNAPETASAFAEREVAARSEAWRLALKSCGSSNEEMLDVVKRVSVRDVARLLESTVNPSPVREGIWEAAVRGLTHADLYELTGILREREPLRTKFLDDASSFGLGQSTLPELSPQDLNRLHFILRFFQVGYCVSCIHQTAWERETQRGTRLIQSMRFGLFEATLVDQVAEMRLLKASESLKLARCLYEVMCSIELIRAAVVAS